jgi:exopolysaccharide biosynthesis polyprenyl glycosylphosphotransferase
MPRNSAKLLRETVMPSLLVAGDTLVAFAGLAFGWWLRYASPLAPRAGNGIFIPVPDATFARYLPLMLIGVMLMVAILAQCGVYDTRLLLRRYQTLNALLKASLLWLLVYPGLALVLKLNPPISRLFVVLTFGCIVAFLGAWRWAVYALVTRTGIVTRLRRRTVVLGWSEDARALVGAIERDPMHPFALACVVTRPGTAAPFETEKPSADSPAGAQAPRLVSLAQLDDLGAVLAREDADLLIIVQPNLAPAEVQRIVEICEHAYVEWKIVPGAFDIFLSSLQLHTIGRVPLLGVEELAINRLFNRGLKRLVDIVGALAGLALSAPVVAVLAALVKRESPGGPVFFRQTRVGANHRPFTLWKLRSMVPEAAATDAARQSTARGDGRLLRIGAFMRRWNLDELPQFWNVLRGDMSLVGPRPERPFHVEQLAGEIPHYLPRHLVKPGMSGWAQVNGLRGDSSIAQRIQHDIYYIENWSLWLDLQILLLTFVRWKNAY